jgi:hypothetical protein
MFVDTILFQQFQENILQCKIVGVWVAAANEDSQFLKGLDN